MIQEVGWALNPMTGPYKRQKKRHRHRGKTVETEVKLGVMCQQVRDHQGFPEPTRGVLAMDSFRTSRKNQLCQHSDFRLLARVTGRE